MENFILTVQRTREPLFAERIEKMSLTTIVNDLHEEHCEFQANNKENPSNEQNRTQQCPQEKNYTVREKNFKIRAVGENNSPRRCPVDQSEKTKQEIEKENNFNLGTTVVQGSGVACTTSPSNSDPSFLPDDLPVEYSLFSLNSWWSVNSIFSASCIERAAEFYRSATAFSDDNRTWCGALPPRAHENTTYSCKVFVGGVPWDITEAELIDDFARFGPIEIVWPGKDGCDASYSSEAGYNHIIFESEKQVKALLQACTHDDSSDGNWYFKISSKFSRRWKSKEVQIVPWAISDSNFVLCPSQRQDPSKTVFVGALHGLLTAEDLALVMHELFGGVVYAGIDTDEHKYPIGSGLVTFNNHKSYVKAISAAFIEIKTPWFKKKVQCDPYIEKDAICGSCQVQQGPIYCRDAACFRYFCRSCWQWWHADDSYLNHHKPMIHNKTNPYNNQIITYLR